MLEARSPMRTIDENDLNSKNQSEASEATRERSFNVVPAIIRIDMCPRSESQVHGAHTASGKRQRTHVHTAQRRCVQPLRASHFSREGGPGVALCQFE